ncbi:hypothetical protein FAM09_14910 [Niastella caeni]|uniref:DUF1795 domain-containing protein n=1 Tax=Niastella caeni TaxID=2569763 RepID=A0A4V6T3S0_9BACT|nr:hypothetical protein [Niastella caeni]THU37976.1 hypothetical protein FAM09_14910 [Niastella caeni]
MRQFTFAILFISCIGFSFCSSGQESFPDKIMVAKSDKLKRVKGTRLFVSTPDNYKPIESMVRMQRDDNTYFQVLEIPNTNFLEYKGSLTKEAIESKGAKVDIDKPVKYNGFDAIYFSGPSKTDGETKLGLAFGDQDFVVMLVGVCKTPDKTAMDELNKIFSTSYYDKSFDLNPLELASFKFDGSITGFKYASSMGNVFIYTPNGKEDLNKQQDDLPIFQFSTIEAPTFSKAKEFLDYTISRYSVQGIQMSDITKKDISINGNPAYEVTIKAKDANNNTTSLYQVIIHKGTKAILFLGSDTKNGKWLDKFKATVQSIQL